VQQLELAPQVHLVVLDDLVYATLRVAHQVQEFVLKEIRLALLPLLKRVIDVPSLDISFVGAGLCDKM
jgi:hypothetical protein